MLPSLRLVVSKWWQLRYFLNSAAHMNHFQKSKYITWSLKFKTYFRETAKILFSVSLNIGRKIRLVAVVRRLTVFLFFFGGGRGVRYKSRETTRVHRVRYYCVYICLKKKSHLRVIVNYGWFTGVNVQGVLPSDFVFQSVAGL